MKKLKEIFEFIKEKLRNPRTRAATILGIYFIFFVFVFILLGTAPKNNTQNNNETNIVNYSDIEQYYEYKHNVEITTTDNHIKYLFTGKVDEENETQKVEFYNNETNQYEETNEYEYVNNKLLNLNNIISYVNNLESEFSTNYKDGTIQKNYVVPITKIDETLDNSSTVEINIYEKNDFIIKITVDSTNLDKIYNENILKIKYVLEYTNLGETVDTEE